MFRLGDHLCMEKAFYWAFQSIPCDNSYYRLIMASPLKQNWHIFQVIIFINSRKTNLLNDIYIKSKLSQNVYMIGRKMLRKMFLYIKGNKHKHRETFLSILRSLSNIFHMRTLKEVSFLITFHFALIKTNQFIKRQIWMILSIHHLNSLTDSKMFKSVGPSFTKSG